MHPTPTTYAGIDWATRSHAVCIIDEHGLALERFEVEAVDIEPVPGLSALC